MLIGCCSLYYYLLCSLMDTHWANNKGKKISLISRRQCNSIRNTIILNQTFSGPFYTHIHTHVPCVAMERRWFFTKILHLRENNGECLINEKKWRIFKMYLAAIRQFRISCTAKLVRNKYLMRIIHLNTFALRLYFFGFYKNQEICICDVLRV